MAADPMYRQIAENLRLQIEEGGLRPGQQLRTELELREKYNASRNTVRDAIKWLITRGLVETLPGQGTFVVQRISPFITTLTGDPQTSSGEGDPYIKEVKAGLRQPSDTAPQVEIKQASSPETAELELTEGTLVVSRHQKRFIDGTPWSLQTSFYPMSLVEKGAQRLIQAVNIDEGTVKYLSKSLGTKQTGYRYMITVRAPDTTEAGFFKLPDDGRVSVVEARQTAFDDKGAPVRLTVSVYPADRNQFAVNVGEVPSEVTGPTVTDDSAAATADDAAGQSG